MKKKVEEIRSNVVLFYQIETDCQCMWVTR